RPHLVGGGVGLEHLAKFVVEPFGAEIALFLGHPLVQPKMRGNHELSHGGASSCRIMPSIGQDLQILTAAFRSGAYLVVETRKPAGTGGRHGGAKRGD